METKQQKETLEYFKKHAQDWEARAKASGLDEVNTVKQRNDYVLKVIDKREKTNFVLDVGCGTGDLVCEVAKKGINAIGVDFSDKMIEISEKNAKKLKCGEKAKFECCSIFDFDFEPDKYDVIAANGFIEYISFKEFHKFLDLSLKGLVKSGSLVISCRNRLFNIFSLNKFTEDEMKNNNIHLLLTEAIQIANADNIDQLVGLKTAPLPSKDQDQPSTGVKVSTRYQYTPAQLISILQEKGFEPVQVFAIHIHGVVPKFKKKHPNVHANIANLLQTYADNMSLVPYSSSFMVHAKKIH
jgi:2-polyprenyl-3-methyl-5-hydroxy-6-metoxy-1,4-benzoquinol methylase